jgi:hypothetical protein
MKPRTETNSSLGLNLAVNFTPDQSASSEVHAGISVPRSAPASLAPAQEFPGNNSMFEKTLNP